MLLRPKETMSSITMMRKVSDKPRVPVHTNFLEYLSLRTHSILPVEPIKNISLNVDLIPFISLGEDEGKN